MEKSNLLGKVFTCLDQQFLTEVEKRAVFKEFPSGTELMKEGQHVKLVPLVLSGLVKVFSRYDDKELLLYYIKPGESCIMSFTAGLKNQQSKVFAITEEPTMVALLPSQLLEQWVRNYPNFNLLFYDLYNLRYLDVIDTIHNLVFENLDYRILEYLKKKRVISGQQGLDIRHREIASELGTSREVITRVLRKLERENKICQSDGKIRIL